VYSGVRSVRGRHTKMNWTPDFHFLIVVTPFTQRCIQVRVNPHGPCVAATQKNELDARYNIPDPEHTMHGGHGPITFARIDARVWSEYQLPLLELDFPFCLIVCLLIHTPIHDFLKPSKQSNPREVPQRRRHKQTNLTWRKQIQFPPLEG
jgi:hypothetical protein